MADSAVDLPPPIVDWVARTGGGRIAQLARHVARREAWVVDVARPDGSVLEGFLRLERAPRPGDPWSLRKETRIVEALGRTEAVPVPRVHGYSDELHCALFERVVDEGIATGVFEPRDRDRAIAFVIDATNRFIHPASLALEADVPQASVDTRLATLIRVILRVLGSGIV